METIQFSLKHALPPPQNNYLYLEGLCSAWLAYNIAVKVLPKAKNDAFMACILSEVGQIILINQNPDYITKILSAKNKKPFTIIEDEMEHYQTHHAVVSYLLGKHWDISNSVCLAVYHHHHSNLDHVQDHYIRILTAIIALSTHIAGGMTSLRKRKNVSNEEQTKYYTYMLNQIKIEENDLNGFRAQMDKMYFVEMQKAYRNISWYKKNDYDIESI